MDGKTDDNVEELDILTYDGLRLRVRATDDVELQRKAIVHGHCHHKAIMGMDDEEALLSKLKLDLEVLDSGCCGMAGSFGFERGERYAVSIGAGERVLLPAVRNADKDTLIIADGFSCREQIAQCTDRGALHLAEVLHMALHPERRRPTAGYPEMQHQQEHAQPPSWRAVAAVAAGGLIILGGIVWLDRNRQRRT